MATVFLLICVAIGVYDCIKMNNSQWDHHAYAPPTNIGYDGWRSRMLAITVRPSSRLARCVNLHILQGVLAADAALYLASACRTARFGIA